MEQVKDAARKHRILGPLTNCRRAYRRRHNHRAESTRLASEEYRLDSVNRPNAESSDSGQVSETVLLPSLDMLSIVGIHRRGLRARPAVDELGVEVLTVIAVLVVEVRPVQVPQQQPAAPSVNHLGRGILTLPVRSGAT